MNEKKTIQSNQIGAVLGENGFIIIPTAHLCNHKKYTLQNNQSHIIAVRVLSHAFVVVHHL